MSVRWLIHGAVVLFALSVSAEGSAAELAWTGAASCERAAYVVETVESLIGRKLETVETTSFAVRVQALLDGSFRLTLVIADTAGADVAERTFQERSCVSVTDAAAVAIAMAIRAGENEGPAPTTPDGGHAKADAPSTEPAAPKRDTTPTPRPRIPPAALQPTFATNLGATADSAALPHPTWGAAVGFSLRIARLRIRAEGAWFAPTSEDLPGSRSSEFQLTTGALLACLERPLGPTTALGCGGYELGPFSGEGRGVTKPHEPSVLWQAARLELGVNLPVAPGLSLLALGGLALPTQRNDFTLEGARVHRTPAASGRAQLGLELIL